MNSVLSQPLYTSGLPWPLLFFVPSRIPQALMIFGHLLYCAIEHLNYSKIQYQPHGMSPADHPIINKKRWKRPINVYRMISFPPLYAHYCHLFHQKSYLLCENIDLVSFPFLQLRDQKLFHI